MNSACQDKESASTVDAFLKAETMTPMPMSSSACLKVNVILTVHARPSSPTMKYYMCDVIMGFFCFGRDLETIYIGITTAWRCWSKSVLARCSIIP